ncbi:MAG: hypothetical protein P8L85_06590 [Rubripirellula sp.]|nr:hypothetical protein [Rubripirellula sp.]
MTGYAETWVRTSRFLSHWRGLLAITIAVCLVEIPHCYAQPPVEEPTASDTTRPNTLALPAALPDGRSLRAIGFYQSQVAELIPKNYQPVQIDELRSAVDRLTDLATDDQTSRVKDSVYWIRVEGDTLVSDQSVLEIESYREGILRRSLGRVNLAIIPTDSRGVSPVTESLPRLESSPDGTLVAVFDGKSQINHTIDFQWRLRGRVSGSGHEFSMRLPPTPQTRIVISAPLDTLVTAVNGVSRRLTSPPPDVIELAPDRTWYELDAGGLENVRIRTQQLDASVEGTSTVVRQSTVQYQAEPIGLSWTCRMVIQPPLNQPLPKLVVRGTTITSAKVNATDVSYSSETLGDRQQYLQLDVPRGLISADSLLVDVTLTGFTTWDNRRGWCALPMPIWVGKQVIYASATDNVELSVSDPIQVVDWELPEDWQEPTQTSTADAPTYFRASGPPIAISRATEADETSITTSQPTWSRIRLNQRPAIAQADTLLRIEESNESLTAVARIALTVDTNRIEPLRLLIQPAWSVDSVTFGHSGRLIETGGLSDSTRSIDLWPESEDLDGDQLLIEVTGNRSIRTTTNAAFPSTWFARINGIRGGLIAALLQPTEFSWSGQSTLERLAGQPQDLDESQIQFFSGTDTQTLWFRPTIGRTPRVELQTPTVAFNTSTLFQVFRDGNDLVETVLIEVQSQSQSLKQLTIDTGPAAGRPPLRWSISGINESPTTSIAPSDIEIGNADRDGSYLIDVSDKVLRGRQLIGRRRYPIEQDLLLPLPAVPGATSQQSEVQLGPGIVTKRKSPSVQRVPFGKLAIARFQNQSPQPFAVADPSQVERLRYDAVEQPSLTIAASLSQPDVTVVWREQVRVIASSRGSDLVEAIYRVTPAADFQIDYDPELQLSSVVRDGAPVDLITLPQRPIVLQTKGRTETIRVRWTRSQFQSSWLRRCRIPQINASGTILRSEHELIAAADTFAPASLWRGQTKNPRHTTVKVQSGTSVTLVRRNIALAFGWLVAFLLFAVSWRIADQSPLQIAALMTVFTTLLFLWWPWRLAVIGWFVVPTLTAAILATTQQWSNRDKTKTTSIDDGSTATQKNLAESTADFSLGSIAKLLFWITCSGYVVQASIGQEPELNRAENSIAGRGTVNVLVPMNREGSVYGNIVYVPKDLKEELFPLATAQPTQTPHIQWASYSLQLDSEISGSNPEAGCSLEVDYLLRIAPSELKSVPVRLPLPPNSVRRIERVDEAGGLIPFRTTSDGQLVATLPQGNIFQLRITLQPAVSQAEQWTKLFLPIPPVAATRLTVESEQDLDAIRFGGATGNLLRETDLRRWVDDLGPVDSLEIDFRSETTTATDSKPLQRRYWVTANANQVTIDCEIDSPTTLAAGEAFQFILRDSRFPTLISTDWKLNRSEQYTPSRRLMTFTSLRDNPGPVRLLWKTPVQIKQSAPPLAIRIPEVIAAALGENAPAWIAIHTDPRVRILPLQNETIEALSVDHFLAAWSGYRSNIDRAIIALTDLPSPILVRQSPNKDAVSQQQEICISQSRLELHYSAIVTPGSGKNQRYSIRYQPPLQLIMASVDGEPVTAKTFGGGQTGELPLGVFRGTEPISIELIAFQLLPESTRRNFTPPTIELIAGAEEVSECVCSLYRTPAVNIQVGPANDTNPRLPTPELTSDLLLKGWVPVARWTRGTTSGNDPDSVSPAIVFESSPVDTRFGCSQLISINRSQSQWTMEVGIRFSPDQRPKSDSDIRPQRLPDFVDIEIPTAWCDNLTIEPSSLTYTQRPATDETRQILRIRNNPLQADDTMISITGRLKSSETGRVSVPAVQVLGAGNRRIYIDVPNRLDDDPIQWRTSAVEAIELPKRWSDQDANRSTYLVASPSWSIDLAPLPRDESGAVVFNADAQVFLREQGPLLLCHWDFYPGNLESMRVRLPKDTELVGAWSAGRAVIPSAYTNSDLANAEYLDLPLSISGLSQPVEILLKLPNTTSRLTSYLPELADVMATKKWLVHYAPATNGAVLSLKVRNLEQQRAISMARGVVDAVSAVGRVAQRPRDEVAAWLALWVKRYQMISQSVGRTVDLQGDLERLRESTEKDTETATMQQSRSIHQQWNALDTELAGLLNRFLPSESTLPSTNPTEILTASSGNEVMFGVGDFEGFEPQQIVALSATNPPRPIQSISDSDLGLRTAIINLLTLAIVGGFLVCLRPLKDKLLPIFIHPAFWLGLLGIFGFAVAPTAVAGALLLVAVTLPAFPSHH